MDLAMNDTRRTKVELIAELTELRRRLSDLETTEERYRNLFDNAPIGIYRTTPEGRILSSNPALIQMLGYSSFAELAALSLEDTRLELVASRSQFKAQLERDGYIHNRESKWRKRDGSNLYVRESANVIRDEQGASLYYDGVVEDITASRRSHLDLERWAAQLIVLNDVGRQIAGSLAVAEVLNRAARLIHEEFGYHHVGIFLVDRERQELILRARAGRYTHLFASDHRLNFRQGIVGRVALSGTSLLANDVESESAYVNLYGDIMPTRSELSVPIWVGREVLGVLDLQSSQLNAFAPSDLLATETLAGQIAIALQNARLYETAQRELAERKRAEAALTQAEQRYRTLFEEAPVMYVIARNQAGAPIVADCNRLFLDKLGYTREEVLNRSLSDFYTPASRARLLSDGYQRALHGEVVLEERELVSRAGGVITTLLQTGLELGDDGQIAGTRAMFLDITERKQAEEALRESEERNRSLEHEQRVLAETLRDIATTLNSTLDLDEVLDHILTRVGQVVPYEAVNLMLIDPQTQIAHVARFHGYMRPEREAYMQSAAFPIDTSPNLRLMVESGQPLVIPDTQHSDLWLKLSDIAWIKSYAGAPIRVKGEVIGFLNLDSSTANFYSAAHAEQLQVFSDQAAIAIENAQLYEASRHHAEGLEQRVAARTRELSEANARLTELDRLKDEFIARMNHELRTPLTSIKIYLEMLETGTKPEKHPKYIQTLKREADRLHKLIEDLLKISQLDAELLAINLVSIDLNQLAVDLIAAHLTAAARRGLELTSTLEPSLPRALADAEAVRQIMANLMSNALQYTQQGTVTLSTWQQVRDDGMWVAMAVHDTGPGLTLKDRAHLFERFYRGQAARDYTTPGMGLGLSFCQQLVERLGGEIAVESVEGQGSAFTVWLKAAAPAYSENSLAKPS
jgi:PAS domain S-box-containing protein